MSNFVNQKACDYIASKIKEHVSKFKQPTKLTETCGLGQNGVYYDKDFNLDELKTIQNSLVETMDLPDNSNNRKTILLGYGLDGENWAHQDANPDYPYQALLMLSEPGEDFTGGQLYSLDGNKDFKKTEAGITARGDVCVFRSNAKFLHGMDRVHKGIKDSTCRIACGLLHKNTPPKKK